MTRSMLALVVALALGCGSSAAAPASATGSTTGAAGALGSAGAAAPSRASVAAASGAGSAGIAAAAASGSLGSAGASGVSGGMTMAAHVCTIPDDIAITMEDGDDAGVAADCKNVPRKIIANNCIGGYCHDNVGPPAAGLDLMSPCVADRLVGVHSMCMDYLLIDPTSAAQSFIHDKVNAQYPKCGKSMPDGGHLPPEEVRCMNAWITAVIRAANTK